MYIFYFGELEIINAGYKQPFEELFPKGLQKGTFTGLACTPMQSIMVSLCDDRTIKKWGFEFPKSNFEV